jgi:hypothetical protein
MFPHGSIRRTDIHNSYGYGHGYQRAYDTKESGTVLSMHTRLKNYFLLETYHKYWYSVLRLSGFSESES